MTRFVLRLPRRLSFTFTAAALATVLAAAFSGARAEEPAAAPVLPPTRPMKYAPVAVEGVIKGILAERARNETFLRYNAMSAYAAVKRIEFGGRSSLVIGSAPDCDLRIEDDLIAPHHVRVTVVGDSFRVESLGDSAIVRIGNDEPRVATVPPTGITIARKGKIIGRYHIRLSHQNDPALIQFDSRAPRLAAFRSLKHYPVDLAWRYMAMLRKAPEGDTLTLGSNRGTPRRALRAGWFDFMVGEKAHRLEAYRLLEPGNPAGTLAVFFKDATNGKDTYSLGRFIDARPVGDAGIHLLDFNLAYTPSCAYSDLYNCPLVPKANVLKIPVTAGEKFPPVLAEE